MIEPIKLSRKDYWKATKRFWWNLVMSLASWKGFSFKRHERLIIDAVPHALTDIEKEVLAFQLSRTIFIERFFRGRFVRLHPDMRRPAPFDNGSGKQPLANVTARQGKLRFKAIVETWDGMLWGLTFSGGKFDPRQPFEIVEVKRGGKPSRLAQAMDRYEHGRDPGQENWPTS